MTDIDTSKLSWDEWDELQNPPPAETDFDRVSKPRFPAAASSAAYLPSVRPRPPWARSAI